MKDIEIITNYLMSNKCFLPIYKVIAKPFSKEEVTPLDHPEKIDLSAYASGVFHYVSALQSENAHIKAVLKELAINDYNVHWHRESKRKILEKFFPELIKELPYYAGGDLNK